MTDRVYPSSKPTTTTPIPTTTTLATAAATKPQQQQPRYPYRLQPQYGNRHHRRINCCYCCFWSLFVLLALALLLAIVGSTLYVLYHPQKPHFFITSPQCQAQPYCRHVGLYPLSLPPELVIQPHAYFQKPQLPHRVFLQPVHSHSLFHQLRTTC